MAEGGFGSFINDVPIDCLIFRGNLEPLWQMVKSFMIQDF